MRRSRHTSVVLALLLVLGGVWACIAEPSVASARVDHAPHGDVVAASHHVDIGVVARPLRSPLPYASVSRSYDALASLGAPLRTPALVPTAHRHAPLYALLRVYRL